MLLGFFLPPPGFLYGYTTSFNYKKHWWTRIGGEIINHFMRVMDFEVSQRPDILIANSKNIARRIKKFYRRESVVIYPPVDLSEFQTVNNERVSSKNKGYFLSLGRLVRGKGTEIIVEACAKLELPLKVAGSGPELKQLSAISYQLSAKHIEFLGEVSDEERINLLAGARALIVASEDEDFGITSIEAQAAGTPVIAVAAGGYLETVIEGKTGTFFDTASVESLMKVLEKFDPSKYKEEDLKKNAARFSKENFKKEILRLTDHPKSV